MSAPTELRRAELVSSLGAVRQRISQACQGSGRDPRSITMIAVTKTYPASDVLALVSLGLDDFGESRDQEARTKIAEIGDWPGSTRPPSELRWHLVGRLQTNKARSVAGYAYTVHSVDRPELAEALAQAVARRQRAEPLAVFIQVSLDGDPSRGGIGPAGVAALADVVSARPELVLRGVMAVAPQAVEPELAFTTLAAVSDRLRAHYPNAVAISAGMSGDLEMAVGLGATHVRVGTALLGRRSPLFG